MSKKDVVEFTNDIEMQLDEKNPERILNRQINYIIIKEIWKSVHKRGTMNEFYNIMGMHKNKYSRMLTGSYKVIKIKTIADNLTKNTCVSREYFVGDKVLYLNNIYKEDWEEYIDLKLDEGGKRQENKIAKNKMEAFEDKLREEVGWIEKRYLGKVGYDEHQEEIYRLYHFMRYGKKFRGGRLSIELEKVIEYLESIDYKELMMLDNEQLQRYYNLVECHKDVLKAIYIRKKYDF